MKLCATYLECQQTHNHIIKTIPHELPSKLWELVGADKFSINNITILSNKDYYRKFFVMKKSDARSLYNLIRAVKIVFKEL